MNKMSIVRVIITPLFLYLAPLVSIENSFQKNNNGIEIKKTSPAATNLLKNNNRPLETEIALFTPPTGWFLVDPNKDLPDSKKSFSSVKVMVVGKPKGTSAPPSMNLSSQPYPHSLKQYLKNIKEKNEAEGYEWKDLGTIQTLAGNASLSQVDTKTQWGTARFMHVILLKNKTIYILTASAPAEDFSFYYKDFFNSMKSLKIIKDPFELISDNKEKDLLKKDIATLQSQWELHLSRKHRENPELSIDQLKEIVFNGPEFQHSIWEPFKLILNKNFGQLGADGQLLLLSKIEDLLFENKS